MLVFHNQGLVLLSIPKTGNTALEAALASHASLAVLGPPDVRHMPWRVYKTAWAPFLQAQFNRRFETFAIMRDPLDRMRSWYRYRALPQFAETKFSTGQVSFEQFVEASLQTDPPPYAKIWTQDRFVSSNAEKVRVTHLFDYARMDEIARWLSERLKRDVSLAPVNASPSRATGLSADLEERLRRARAGEFALYARVAETGYMRTD